MAALFVNLLNSLPDVRHLMSDRINHARILLPPGLHVESSLNFALELGWGHSV